ncbi:hypothetical protein IIA15_05615, partial [candidate division TA06 bacterium]|nr:hypothetical protein [candidate division TA06 bacterium]
MSKKSLIHLAGLSFILGLSLVTTVSAERSCIEKGKGVCMKWNQFWLDNPVDIEFNGAITIDGDISDWPASAKVGELWVA